MPPEPECVANCKCELGENPLWNQRDGKLYWIDIQHGVIYRFDPKTECFEEWYRTERIGGFTIQEDGSFLLFLRAGRIACLSPDRTLSTIYERAGIVGDHQFNDVIADPSGRVFCGTLSASDKPGGLFCMERNGRLKRILSNIGCSNGLGFSPDRHVLYFTDSKARTIYSFDYHQKTGTISNKKALVVIPEGDGLPDGLTVDQLGNIWSARWDGGCVVKYDPEGNECDRIAVPVSNVTSVVFGGDNLDHLYITTACSKPSATTESHAGSLFRVKVTPGGVREFGSRVHRRNWTSLFLLNKKSSRCYRKKILITGGAGCVARALGPGLQEKYDLTLIDKKQSDGVQLADLTSPEEIAPFFAGIETVIHLGAASSPYSAWSHVLNDNIVGTYNVFEQARISGVNRVIFASTNWVMGGYIHRKNKPSRKRVHEFRPRKPTTPYGLSKSFGEDLGLYFYEQFGLSCVVFRIGWVTHNNEPCRNHRDEALWLSWQDCTRLIESAIESDIGYDVFNATSNIRHNPLPVLKARLILGYRPTGHNK